MVANSGRERVVAQHIADMTFLSSISRTRRPFFEANVPIIMGLMIPLVVPINEMQVKPCLMVATLIIGS